MKAPRPAHLLILAAFSLAVCGPGPKVVQGTVSSHDTTAQVMVVRDECPPNPEIQISLEGAEIGADPEPNDLVRVAYHGEGERFRAIRVMNLTRQKELGLAATTGTMDRCQPPPR